MRLADPLPQTVLIVGPEGVGKRLAAELLAGRSGARSVDVQRLGRLDVAGAQAMSRFHASRPFGSVKVSVADVGSSSVEAVNALLKLLEEPPSSSRIILHSDRMPLLTVVSRCTLLRFGLLSTEEVEAVCRAEGMSAEQAQQAAVGAGGRPGAAMRWAGRRDAVRVVQGVVGALGKGDAEALENALMGGMRGRDEESPRQVELRREQIAEMLGVAIRESVTEYPRAFGVEDVAVLARAGLDRRMRALRMLGEASRPGLRVRSASWVLASGMER